MATPSRIGIGRILIEAVKTNGSLASASKMKNSTVGDTWEDISSAAEYGCTIGGIPGNRLT
jgi:hypothetical protein